MLRYPEHSSSEVKSLINQLLMPTPEARIGAGARGFAGLKKHPFFSCGPCDPNTMWEALAAGTVESPLQELAAEERRHILQEGLEGDLLDSFDLVEGDGAWALGANAVLLDYLDAW